MIDIKSRTQALRRLLWLLVAAVATIAYCGLVAPCERRIAASQLHSRMLYDEVNLDRAKIAQSTSLERVKRRIRDQVRALSGPASAGATAAGALHLFAAEAARFRTDLRSITPDVQASPAAAPSRDGVSGTDWILVVRGHFRDALGFLNDVSRRDVLVDVRDVDVASLRSTTERQTTLDFTVRATVYRPTTFEDQHAATDSR